MLRTSTSAVPLSPVRISVGQSVQDTSTPAVGSGSSSVTQGAGPSPVQRKTSNPRPRSPAYTYGPSWNLAAHVFASGITAAATSSGSEGLDQSTIRVPETYQPIDSTRVSGAKRPKCEVQGPPTSPAVSGA